MARTLRSFARIEEKIVAARGLDDVFSVMDGIFFGSPASYFIYILEGKATTTTFAD